MWFSQPVRARRAMVATADALATDAGLDILSRGGSAADAAVAAGLVLSVTQPGMCGLGGGGHAVLRRSSGEIACLDFRERAPAAAHRDMFHSGASTTQGWLAAAVPGTLRGFAALHTEFGRLPWRELFAPAIAAALSHPLSYQRAMALRASASLPDDPESARILLRNGNHFDYGETLRQPELAHTLERLAHAGPDDFYTGEIAARLASEITAHGGIVTAADLANYRIARRKVLSAHFRDYEIFTAPPPSFGGLGLLQMLGMLQNSTYNAEGHNSAHMLHTLAAAMRRSFLDRNQFAADPDFVPVPVAELLHPAESEHTTHFSILDPDGNAVSLTFTLNRIYGSGVTVPGLGFLLNNNMDNFAAFPGQPNQYGLVQGEANRIEPGKMPVSSMTPVIATRQGQLILIGGTPGGPTIPTAMLQALLNVIDFGMNAQDAVSAPRIHHQWMPDVLYVEPGFSPDTLRLLEARGHRIETRLSNNDMNLIRLTPQGIEGAIDPRREGKAAGL